MRSTVVVAALASLVHVSAAAASESSLTCAGGLVGIGDATIDLLGKCGAPALRESRVADERWTYDFGPQRFLMFVALDGGRVVGIERGGYGHGDASPLPVAIPRATCETGALHVGDAKVDLLARCGEPAAIDVRYEAPRLTVTGVSAASALRAGPAEVEVWTYDFGPNAFLRFVVLQDGMVTRVDTGSYGYAR
jgi:hypothetical protein